MMRVPDRGSRSRTRTIATRPLRRFRTRAVVPSGRTSLAALSEFSSTRPPSAILRPAKLGANTAACPRLTWPEGSEEAAGCAKAGAVRTRRTATAKTRELAIGHLSRGAEHNAVQLIWVEPEGCRAPPPRPAGHCSRPRTIAPGFERIVTAARSSSNCIAWEPCVSFITNGEKPPEAGAPPSARRRNQPDRGAEAPPAVESGLQHSLARNQTTSLRFSRSGVSDFGERQEEAGYERRAGRAAFPKQPDGRPA
jgi:hypothetical protein